MALPVIAALLLLGLPPAAKASGAAAVEIRSVYLEACITDCRIVCGNYDLDIKKKDVKITQYTMEGCCATLKETFSCVKKPFRMECTDPQGLLRPVNLSWTGCDDLTSAAPPMTVPTSAAPPMTVPTSAAPPMTVPSTSAAPRSTDLPSTRGIRIAVVAASICMSIILTGIFIWKSRKRLCRQISGGDAASPPDLEHGPPEHVILNGYGIRSLHHLQETKL